MAVRMDGYVRVSRVGGREGDSFISPKVQREKIEAWAKLKDVELGEVVEELDVSGGKAPEERALGRLLECCERGESGGVVVYRIDRLGRDAADTLLATKRLKRSGARLVSIEDGVDTATESGRLVLGVMALVAEQQLDRARENWRVARTDAKRRGKYLSGFPATGYERDELGGLVPNPDVAPHIRQAFKMRADGASFAAVADYLTNAGVLPRAGRRNGGTPRTRWSREGIRQLVRNPIYCGKPRGENAEAVIEPIVSPEEFDAAQIPVTVYARNGRCQVGVLGGLIRCAGCGNRLHVAGAGPTYLCKGRSAAGVCPAPAGGEVARVDAYVVERLMEAEDDVLKGMDAAIAARTLAEEAVLDAELELRAFLTHESALDEFFEQGYRERQAALNAARRRLAETPDPGLGDTLDRIAIRYNGEVCTPAYWDEIPIEILRRHMRYFIAEVTLTKADFGRGRWQPIGDRVQVRWVGQG